MKIRLTTLNTFNDNGFHMFQKSRTLINSQISCGQLRGITQHNLPDWALRHMRQEMKKVIEFYRAGAAYGEFSNFARYPIKLKGKTWQTSEHYFQAMKFENTADQEAVRNASTPINAARIGRDRKRKLRRDWESVKDNVMREALWAKFSRHRNLAALLLSTGSLKLVEHTENDAYWGDGGDGSGKNMLGKLLMEVRERLSGLAT